MNLADTLRVNSGLNEIPMVRLEVNGSGGFNVLDSDINLTDYATLGSSILTASQNNIHTGVLSMASASVTPLRTDLSDETIDRIANRVYELIRQRGIE